jgi:hypothetical protein
MEPQTLYQSLYIILAFKKKKKKKNQPIWPPIHDLSSAIYSDPWVKLNTAINVYGSACMRRVYSSTSLTGVWPLLECDRPISGRYSTHSALAWESATGVNLFCAQHYCDTKLHKCTQQDMVGPLVYACPSILHSFALGIPGMAFTWCA